MGHRDITPHFPRAQTPSKTAEKSENQRSDRTAGKKSILGWDRAAVLRNSQPLWLPARDLYTIKPDNIPAWMGWEAHGSHTLSWGADGSLERDSQFSLRVWPLGGWPHSSRCFLSRSVWATHIWFSSLSNKHITWSCEGWIWDELGGEVWVNMFIKHGMHVWNFQKINDNNFQRRRRRAQVQRVCLQSQGWGSGDRKITWACWQLVYQSQQAPGTVRDSISENNMESDWQRDQMSTSALDMSRPTHIPAHTVTVQIS